MSEILESFDHTFNNDDIIKACRVLTGNRDFSAFLPETRNTCDECLVSFEAKHLKKCSRCKSVSYCSKQCQTLAWRSHHKMMCNVVKIEPIAGKGLGLIAMKDIEKGTLILKELPLVKLYCTERGILSQNFQQLDNLSDKDKRKLMSLSGKTSRMPDSLAAKLAVNKMASAEYGYVMYYNISRINHSCMPNVQADPSPSAECPIIALKDIKQGEELCYDYIFNTSKYLKCEERREKLRRVFCIPICECAACSLSGARKEQSDNNRLELECLENELRVLQDPIELMSIVDRKLEIYKQEGLDTADNLIQLCDDAMVVSTTRDAMEKHRREGLNYAREMQDDRWIGYFERAASRIFFGQR